ncbi:MAG TPA: right-handed parallel beta-helix repeat-containing protein [Planctomycetota bacterium]|nr:right-handed parallel beta-helix repeat-containing protein [Planctomycetota bacterium]
MIDPFPHRCVLVCLLAMSPAAVLAAEAFFVSPEGKDSWSGRLRAPSPDGKDGPLATLGGARDAIRRLKARGPLREAVRVTVRGGTYRITEPFVLEPQDSGTKDAPITYAAEGGSRPVVSGGRPIRGWKRDGKLWVVEVPGVKSGAWSFGALWVNGERRRRARTPNDGWLYTAGKDPGRAKTAFLYRPGDITKWRNIDDACVVVYHSWETSLHRIASIDEASSTVVFTGPAAWAFENWGPRQRYHLENVPEALDAPGEWYLDRRAGVLSYMPLDGEEIEKAEVVAPVAKQLVVLAGEPAAQRLVEHVSFEGLRFLHTEWTLPEKGHSDSQAAASIQGALEAAGARHCAFIRCEVGHVATYGVWLRAGSQDNRLEECEIHDLGAGGLRIGETRNPASEAEAAERNSVNNCFIHDGGKIFAGGVGVWIGRSSHNTVAHSEVCDFDYSGFSVGWSWGYDASSAHHNVIEYNHIHDLGRGVLNDLGAIYTLGVSPGTVERFNVMHDIYCHSFGGWGVYTDEGSTGILIENNIVYNTSSGCFHQHYGKENILRNNVFAFGLEGVLRRSREEDHTSFIFERNIVLSRGTPFHFAQWSNGKYQIDSNLYWDYEERDSLFAGKTFAEWQAMGRDGKSMVADPLCADPERFDFRLKPGSPAARIGFKPLDPSESGLRGDPAWRSLPGRVKRAANRPPSPPPPEPITDDFEETPVDAEARGAATRGETAAARIRVTEETAASGKRSLKFTDAQGLDHRFNPHLYYLPNFWKGTLEAKFSLRVEEGAVAYHEWRDAATPYRAGPSFRIEADGRLFAGGRELARIPHGKWVDVEITCGLGRDASGKWDLAVKLPGADPPRRFHGLPCDPALRELRWLGFVADADAPAVFYLDRVSLKPRGAAE